MADQGTMVNKHEESRRPATRRQRRSPRKDGEISKTRYGPIILNCGFAGRKAVIVRSFDDGTRDSPYSQCLVASIAKYPGKAIQKNSANNTTKKSMVKAFLKVINFTHTIPTRYTLDMDPKDVVTLDSF